MESRRTPKMPSRGVRPRNVIRSRSVINPHSSEVLEKSSEVVNISLAYTV